MRATLGRLVCFLAAACLFGGNARAALRDPGVAVAPQFDGRPHVTNEIILKLKPTSGALVRLSRAGNGRVSTTLPSLDTALAEAGAADMLPNPRAGTGRTKRVLSPEAAQARQRLAHRFKLRLKPGTDMAAALKRLAQNPHVEFAEPNYLFTTSAIPPNDSYYTNQWGLNNVGQTVTIPGVTAFTGTADKDINAPEAWAITQGSSVVVAVIDTGVDWDHPDLAANIWSNPGEIPGNGIDDDGNGFIDDVRGWDFVSVPSTDVFSGEDPGPPDNNPMDFQGHGTHVSGIIGAVANNARGIAGVAPQCRIMPLRAGYKATNGGGSLTEEDIADALVYAADNGAQVVNMSFGGGFSSAISTAVNYALAAGVILVAAAGNENTSTPSYPAAYQNVISVAAVDSKGNRASFSNFGWWIDVSGPGVSIISTYFNDTYASSSGTSMACPHVVGVAALVIADHPTFSAAAVRSQVILTAKDLLTPGWDQYTGYGLVDARAALGNHAPTIAPIPAQSTPENATLGPISLTVGDIDSSPSGLVVSGQSSNPALVPVSWLVFGGSGASRNLTVTPTGHGNGTSTITVTVKDPGLDGIPGNADDLSSSASFVLTVQPVNDAPTITSIADASILENAGLGPITFTVGDIDNDVFGLVVTGQSSNPAVAPVSGLVFGGSGASRDLTVNPVPHASGTATITLTVTDAGLDGIPGNGDDLSAMTSFVLTVQAVNDPPSFDPVADITAAFNADPLSVPLTGISAGPLESAQTLTITATSSNPTFLPDPVVQYTSPNPTGSLLLSPVHSVAGSATVTVTLTDDGAPPSSVVRTFQITVDSPPVDPTDTPLLPYPWNVILCAAVAAMGGRRLLPEKNRS